MTGETATAQLLERNAARNRAYLCGHLRDRIFAALYGRRFQIHDEKTLQHQIETVFRIEGIDHAREVPITGGTIDFVAWTDSRFDTVLLRAPRVKLGIEVKIKGSCRDISRQIRRYAAEPELDALMLIAHKNLGRDWFGDTGGKPVEVFDLSRAWL
jgi:hypothetical protein